LAGLPTRNILPFVIPAHAGIHNPVIARSDPSSVAPNGRRAEATRQSLALVLANAEAITGQIYLAIFIARLVGLHIAHELKRER
jgi:hypothetical protein